MKKTLKTSVLSLATLSLLATAPNVTGAEVKKTKKPGTVNSQQSLSNSFSTPFSNPFSNTLKVTTPPISEVIVDETALGSTYTYVGSFDSSSYTFDTIGDVSIRFAAAFATGIAIFKYISDDTAKIAATALASSIFASVYTKPSLTYFRTYMQVRNDGDGYMSTRKTVISYSDSARTKQIDQQTFYSTRFYMQ